MHQPIINHNTEVIEYDFSHFTSCKNIKQMLCVCSIIMFLMFCYLFLMFDAIETEHLFIWLASQYFSSFGRVAVAV